MSESLVDVLLERTERQRIRMTPPPVTPIEKDVRRWPDGDAADRCEPIRPPFEGHRKELGEA